MKLLPLLLPLALVAGAPTAMGAFYSCESYAVVALCWGADDAPDCPAGNSASDWGVDAYVVGGVSAGAGGRKWCATASDGATEGKSMDAGVYRGAWRVVVRSEEVQHTPTGSAETTTTCVTTVEAAVLLVSQAREASCVVGPVHPRDATFPDVLP